jgi:hypothetical protein
MLPVTRHPRVRRQTGTERHETRVLQAAAAQVRYVLQEGAHACVVEVVFPRR